MWGDGVGCWCGLLVWVVGVGFPSCGVGITNHVEFYNPINVLIDIHLDPRKE